VKLIAKFQIKIEKMDLQKWKSLTKTEQNTYWNNVTENYTRYRTTELKYQSYGNNSDERRNNRDERQPCCVGRLYTDEKFPSFSKPDDCSLSVSEDNIYNGSLVDIKMNVVMKWEGYYSQLYDGQMCMYQVNENSTINGIANGLCFSFKGVSLSSGLWPEFICMYEKAA
jgi:hypothetical protein